MSKAARQLDAQGLGGGPLRRAAAAAVHAWIWLLAWCVRLLPRPLAYGLGSLLGLFVWLVLRWRDPRLARRGRGVARNLRLALGPAATPARIADLERAYARHLGWLVVDLLRFDGLRLRRDVDTSELEARVVPIVAQGRGLIVITGHMGSWEHLGAANVLLGCPMAVLARPIPIQGVQRWLLARRRRAGLDPRSKFGGLWGARKALQAGEGVGLVVDENDRHGQFVPFCGVLAATNPSPAQLQRLTGAPIAVLTTQRLAAGRWKLHVWELIEPVADEPREAAEARVTPAIAAALERALRAYPEQWLWSLRRWETRPPGEVADGDGLPPRVGPGLLG